MTKGYKHTRTYIRKIVYVIVILLPDSFNLGIDYAFSTPCEPKHQRETEREGTGGHGERKKP